jgi:hypothetical protein
MAEDTELLALCRPGMRLSTRDRRGARILRVCPAEGLVYGEVEMQGACVWRADGRYRDAPFGAPGPLDLMMPNGLHQTSLVAPEVRETASVREAIEAGNRLFCCD